MAVANIVWQIDWEDNGFDSDLDDVTELRTAATLNLGGRVGPKGFVVSPASGTLTIHNVDGTYDPDAPGGISETNLRNRRDARCTVDGSVVWTGKAQFFSKNETSRLRTLTWQLSGRDTTVATEGEFELDIRGGTVADVIAAVSDASGLVVAGGTSQPVGFIRWKGNPLYALEAIQRFGGGFMIERSGGDWQFIRWTDTPRQRVVNTFDNQSYHLIDGYRLSERAGWVRNFTEAVATTRATALSDERVSTTLQMNPQTIRIFVLGGVDTSVSEDISRLTVEPSTASVVATSFRQISGSNIGYIRVQTTAAHPPGTAVTVTGFGRSTTETESEPRRLDIEVFDTQEVFGERALKMPPWFSQSFDGLQTWVRPWLRNLSQPALIYDATYVLASDPSQNAAIVRDASPGNRCSFDTPRESFDGVVLATRLVDNLGHVPTWTVEAIAAVDRPAPPLGVIVNPSDVQAEIIVSSEHADGRNVYGRYRTS